MKLIVSCSPEWKACISTMIPSLSLNNHHIFLSIKVMWLDLKQVMFPVLGDVVQRTFSICPLFTEDVSRCETSHAYQWRPHRDRHTLRCLRLSPSASLSPLVKRNLLSPLSLLSCNEDWSQISQTHFKDHSPPPTMSHSLKPTHKLLVRKLPLVLLLQLTTINWNKLFCCSTV